MKEGKQIRFIDGEMVEYEILPLVDSYDSILKESMPSIDFETTPGNKIAYMSLSLMESLNHHGGVGLAANQVGLRSRMCAIINEDKLWCLINPIITDKSTSTVRCNEGCLSFPGLFLTINRSSWVDVDFYAANGEKLSRRLTGLPAIIAQHEIDHLDGIVFTTKVSPIKLDIAKRKAKTNLRKMKHAENVATNVVSD